MSVLPFSKFSGVDIVLGPEMKSTGEVMGISSTYDAAFYKSQVSAGSNLTTEGTIFISVKDEDKRAIVLMAKQFEDMGFEIFVGCMVGSSLGMAPATLVAQGASFVDLDGPLLLAEDRANGLRYEGSTVHPPISKLWG